MPDTDLLLGMMKNGARDIRETFTSPDADWDPVAFLLLPDDTVTIMGLDPKFLTNDLTKDALVAVICHRITELEPGAVGMIFSTWTVRDLKEKPEIQPKDHPERREELLLVLVEPDNVQAVTAPIYRDGEQPPALGQWDEEDTGAVHTGRFINPIINTLKEVRDG